MGTLFGIVRKHLKISDINHIKHIRMSFASGGQFPCKIVPLSKYSVTDLKKNEVFMNATKMDLETLKGLITGENGDPKKGKKGILKVIEKKIKNIEDEEEKNKHRKELEVNEDQLPKFQRVLKYNKMREDLISKLGNAEEADEFLNEHGINTVYNIAKVALESKQCNEPYEILLSDLFDIKNIDEKHGFDGIDLETGKFLEYKPSSNTNNPCGTINDDSTDKIEKCENLEKGGWLVLAGIDKEKYTFNKIYRFPLEIYNEDRRKYLKDLKKSNSGKEKQTRSTYSINIKKSIELCNKFNKDYYVWER
tara:strand:+ start:891 stop:1811 length:921 start_codon:yes stop_codon:yes gene_type:complete